MAALIREEIATPLSPEERRHTRRMSSVSGEPQWLEQLIGIEKVRPLLT